MQKSGSQVPSTRRRGFATGLLLSLLLAAPLLSTSVTPAAARKYSSIVVDAETGRVIEENNANGRRYPASLTKMMTLYLAFTAIKRGRLKFTQRLRVSRRAARQPRTRLGLRAGSTISARNAILGLITRSANDAAVVIAETLASSETRFARKMTRTARKLGMRRTVFRNASGLYNKGQFTTARDMATLAVALMRDFPRYYRLFSTQSFVYRGQVYRNHNRLLGRVSGVDGVKTGYIRAAGFNLVASSVRNNRRLVGVVMGGRTARRRDRQMKILLARGYRARRYIRATRLAVRLDQVSPKSRAVTHRKRIKKSAIPKRPGRTAVARARLTPRFKPGGAMIFAATMPVSAELYKSSKRGAVITPVRQVASVRPLALKRPWIVQVGAFRLVSEAQRAAAAALGAAPGELYGARVDISPVKSEVGDFFRARIEGITPRKAVAACQKLHRRNMPCIAMRSGAPLRQYQ